MNFKEMEVVGIKFAPFNIPPRRRLETLAAGWAFAFMAFGGFFGFIAIFYIIFYTHHWPEALFYLYWAWRLDTDICEEGGRPSDWVRDWTWWTYVKTYFPMHLERVPWAELDPKKNYLFCSFPHGIFPMGAFTAFGTNAAGFKQWFPYHQPHLLTLRLNFLFPLIRELIISLGVCSASARSLNSILGHPGGGKVAVLVVGGAEEAYYCRPGEYRVVVKKRKGFIKIALRNGSPLVPVFTFGETDLFNQVDNPKGSTVRRVQDWIKNATGVAPVIPLGRGYLQYRYGLVPFRRPVWTIVGKPIEIEKVEYPTQEQIDALHDKFVSELEKLFEEQKHNYLINADKATLIIS